MPRRRKVSNLDRERDTDTAVNVGLSCIGVVWTLLTILSLAASCVGFYLPYWLKGTIPRSEDTPTRTYIGIFGRCHYQRFTDTGEIELVLECGRYSTFSDIPSQWWQIGTVTISAGCILLLFVTVTGLFSCCVRGILSHCSAKIAGVLQFISGVCVACGCVLYPLGWASFEVKNACGEHADIFKLGECKLSWAYYTIIAGSAGTFLCALLSCHSVRYKGYQRTQV